MFRFFKDIFSAFTETKSIEINPANGLPMFENSHIDVEGNDYGFSNDSFDFGSSFSNHSTMGD